ncbi:DNA-binding protein WhiA [Miniphocaeibacter massiliensis]|uniref:DNA-binding protein WhiA n=1 Tax=Miniphocaeibacter massiliensis TaxID=2041841 RepID=UPI000C087CBE|nr:DNA-binding protein WhiA [Miniphocaeibacter massiliensis]
MSFSVDVKNEVSRIKVDSKEEILAELGAMFRVNGTILKNNQNLKLKFTTEINLIARRIFTEIKQIYDYDSVIEVSKNNQLRKKSSYRIYLEGEIAQNFLFDIGLDDDPFSFMFLDVPEKLVDTKKKKKAYIRGSFLGAGSISSPEKAYHLEIITGELNYSKEFVKLLNSYNILASIVERNENYVIYIKDSEMISDFLSLIEAFQNLFKFENIRVVKEIKNNVNRVMNCESANMDKTIEASLKQIEDIELIDENIGLENIDINLQEIAEIRRSNPEYSLKQIGEMLNPSVGKSGINHRFKKLRAIADKFR